MGWSQSRHWLLRLISVAGQRIPCGSLIWRKERVFPRPGMNPIRTAALDPAPSRVSRRLQTYPFAGSLVRTLGRRPPQAPLAGVDLAGSALALVGYEQQAANLLPFWTGKQL